MCVNGECRRKKGSTERTDSAESSDASREKWKSVRRMGIDSNVHGVDVTDPPDRGAGLRHTYKRCKKKKRNRSEDN